MSQMQKVGVTCPKCQHKGEYERWDSINVTLDPEMEEKVYSGQAFLWKCPACGAQYYLPYDTLYHDMKNKFMIFFFRDAPEADQRYQPTGLPDVSSFDEAYRFRVVYNDFYALQEKILIFHLGLNDVVIERLKYMITHEVDPSYSEKGIKLFFAGTTDPDKEDQYGRLKFNCEGPNGENMGSISIPILRYYQLVVSMKDDTRFAVPCWMSVDEGWIAAKLQEEE